MSEKRIEVVCSGCGKPLFYGQVLGDFAIDCRRCRMVMTVEVPKPVPALAAAIVEAMQAAPMVTVDGKTVCNCSECRLRRN